MSTRSQTTKDIFHTMSSMRGLLFSHGKAHTAEKGMPSRAQFGLLMLIAYHGPQSIKDLAERFGVSSSGITQLVDGLVKDKLLKRIEDTTDRRKTSISLTAEGKSKVAQAEKARLAWFTKAFSALTDAELEQFKKLQTKIIAGLK